MTSEVLALAPTRRRCIADIFAVDASDLVCAEQRVETATRLDGGIDQRDGTDTGNAAEHGRAGIADIGSTAPAIVGLAPNHPL